MGNTAAANTQLRTERAHITGVYSLAGRNLQQLPAELLQKLSGPSTLAPLLKSLDLSGNRLEQLPKEMGALTQLRRLNLSRNRLAVVSDAEAETVWQAWRKLEVLVGLTLSVVSVYASL